MIVIVSSSIPECAALGLLCSQQGWVAVECNSVRSAKATIRRTSPRVVLMRYRISDGYSDDIIALLAKLGTIRPTRVIILLPAGTPSGLEARQLRLGADCVLRDPIRSEVMVAYIEKYIATTERGRSNESLIEVEFIGAMLNPGDRTLKIGERAVVLTPREALLVELLSGHADGVVSYDLLYSEILRRKFDGDTSNMRVLLAKLDASTEKIGLSLRTFVKVIPKMGYRYEHQRVGL